MTKRKFKLRKVATIVACLAASLVVFSGCDKNPVDDSDNPAGESILHFTETASNGGFESNEHAVIYSIACGKPDGRSEPIFVAVGADGTGLADNTDQAHIAWSADGITWTSSGDFPSEYALECVGFGDYSGGRFVAAGRDWLIPGDPEKSEWIYYSDDGTNWTATQLDFMEWAVFGNIWLKSIAYGNGKFVAVGYSNMGFDYPIIMYSSDGGASWNAANRSWFTKFEGVLRGVIWDGSRFLAVGETSAMMGKAMNLIISSADGANWNVVYEAEGESFGLHSIAYGGGMYVIGGDASMFTSSNGTNWQEQPGEASSFWTVSGVAYGGGLFVAVSEAGEIGYSTNGASWTKIRSRESNPFYSDYGDYEDNIYGIAFGTNRFVAVGQNVIDEEKAKGQIGYSNTPPYE
jgi:hypothetical protein